MGCPQGGINPMVRRGIKNLRMGKSQKLSEAASEAVSAAIVRKNQPLHWPRNFFSDGVKQTHRMDASASGGMALQSPPGTIIYQSLSTRAARVRNVVLLASFSPFDF